MDDLTAFLRARLDAWERRITEACRSTGESDEESATWGWVRADRADIDSKRRIIDEHQPRTVTITDYEQYAPGVVICSTCSYPHGNSVGADEYTPHPCKTLRLLALPNAGHPDYREAWRP